MTLCVGVCAELVSTWGPRLTPQAPKWAHPHTNGPPPHTNGPTLTQVGPPSPKWAHSHPWTGCICTCIQPNAQPGSSSGSSSTCLATAPEGISVCCVAYSHGVRFCPPGASRKLVARPNSEAKRLMSFCAHAWEGERGGGAAKWVMSFWAHRGGGEGGHGFKEYRGLSSGAECVCGGGGVGG